MEKSKMAKIK
jgi:serine/threonine protein kinase